MDQNIKPSTPWKNGKNNLTEIFQVFFMKIRKEKISSEKTIYLLKHNKISHKQRVFPNGMKSEMQTGQTRLQTFFLETVLLTVFNK